MQYTHIIGVHFQAPRTLLYCMGIFFCFVLFVTWSIGHFFWVFFRNEALVKCFRKLKIIVCRNQEAMRYTFCLHCYCTRTHARTYVWWFFTNTANLGPVWIRRIKSYCIWLRPVKCFSNIELQQNPSCCSLLPSFLLPFFVSSFHYYFPHFIFNF
jgi:hypothetical protein